MARSIPGNATAKRAGVSLVNGVQTVDAFTVTITIGVAILKGVLLAEGRCLAAIAMMFTSKCLQSSRKMHTFSRSSLCSLWLYYYLLFWPFRVIYVYTERKTHTKNGGKQHERKGSQTD